MSETALRSLRAAESLDEVAPAYAPGLFHRAQDWIEPCEAAGPALGDDCLPGQHPVTLKEDARLRVQALGRRRSRPKHLSDQ